MKIPTIKIPQAKKQKPAAKVKLKDLSALLPFAAAKKKVLSIEIGEEWLKIVFAVRQGRQAKMASAYAESIAQLSEIEVSQKILSFMTSRALKPDEVVISHPTHNLTTRILSLPSTDPKEIRDIVDLQAVKQTPYTREEITSGFMVLDREASGYSRVLVAISHHDVSSRYARIVEMAGLRPERIGLSLEGIMAWHKKLEEGQAAAEAHTLLLDVDFNNTDFLIFNGAKLVFHRSMAFGMKHLAEPGSPAEADFLREVQRSVESAQPELKEGRVGQVVISGSGQTLKNFAALLSRELNLPASNREVFPEGGGFEEAAKQPVSFASLSGLALGDAARIDLTPPEVLVRKGLEDRAKDLAWMGTLLLALVGIVSLISFQKIYKKTAYLGELQMQYSGLKDQAQEVERVIAKMKLALEQRGSGAGFLEVMKDITEVIPDNITLISVQFDDKEHAITLRGTSPEMSAVFGLLSTLEGTPHLEAVKTKSVTKRKVENQDIAEFEMTANVRGLPPETFAPGGPPAS